MTTNISRRMQKADASVIFTEGLITHTDEGFTQLTGYSREETINRPIMDFLRNDLRASVPDIDLNNPEGSRVCFIFTRLLKPLEVKITIKSMQRPGEYIAQFRRMPPGIHAGSVFAAARLMDENAALACFALEPAIFLISANRAYLNIMNIRDLGDVAGTIAGRAFPSWHEGVFDKMLKIKACKQNEAPGYIDCVACGADGESESRHVRCKFLPILERGKTKYIIEALTVRDQAGLDRVVDGDGRNEALRVRTEGELAENYEVLLREERSARETLARDIEAKNEFIAFISHEFKTPLAIINSAVQAIEYLCRDELTEQFKGFLKKIKQNSFRQLRLVNNLLDMTRLNAGRFKVTRKNLDIVHLAREITESVRLYAQQKKITLEFDTEIPSMMIGIDEEKFERIMLNLLSNAIKYTPENRRVGVKVSEKESGKYVSVAVTDEGVGIPREKQHLLFERFGQVENTLTRQAGGTGIGLSLVKKMVSVLGGTICVESESGKGSTFEVTLPVMPADDEPHNRNYEIFADGRLAQAIEIEFSD
jgi:signal transduction histidine kinase